MVDIIRRGDRVSRLNENCSLEYGIVADIYYPDQDGEAYSDDESDYEEPANVEQGVPYEQQEDGQTGNVAESDGIQDSEISMRKILVIWCVDRRQEVVLANSVHLEDWTPTVGTVVRRLKRGDSQLGYCSHVEVEFAGQIVGTDLIISNANSKNLADEFKKPESCSVVDIVSLNSWIGKVTSTSPRLQVSLPDGTETFLHGHIISGHISVELPVGELLKVPRKVLDFTPGLDSQSSGKVGNQLVDVIVKGCEIDLSVLWTCQAYNKDGVHPEVNEPKPVISVQENAGLKSTSTLTTNFVVEGCEYSRYKVSECDVVIEKEQWMKERGIGGKSRSDVTSQEQNQKLVQIEPGNLVKIKPIITRTTMDVVWQDGSVTTGVPTNDLDKVSDRGDYRLQFFPGDIITKEINAGSYGVLQAVDPIGKTARVKWFEFPEGDPEPTFLMENEESFYDFWYHPALMFMPGAVVMQVANFQGDKDCSAGIVCCYELDGKVRVSWLEGHYSFCWPRDLNKVPERLSKRDSAFGDDSNQYDGSKDDHSNEDDENDNFKDIPLVLNEARVRLGEISERLDSSLQDLKMTISDVLEVYGKCLVVDFLTLTKYFQTSNFEGVLERVHEWERRISAKLYKPCETLPAKIKKCRFSETSTEGCESSSNTERGSINEMTVTDNDVHDVDNTAAGQPGETKADEPATDPELLSCTADCKALCAKLMSQIERALDYIHLSDEPVTVPSSLFDEPTNDGEPKSEKGHTDSDLSDPAPFSKPTPSVASVVADEDISPVERGVFSILDTAPASHQFEKSIFQPSDPKTFSKRVREEIMLLKSSLPDGTWVTSFADRMDLYSVMIRGPENTPYENGLFFFDVQLPSDYPLTAPTCHYISYSSESLNPNLYLEGRVCLSLLGTWRGLKEENWSPKSTLLQLVVSIQGLILVEEPYFNEPSYETEKGTPKGKQKSRMFNEKVVLGVVEALRNLLKSPHEAFQEEILGHFKARMGRLRERLEGWMSITDRYITHLSASVPKSSPLFLSEENLRVALPDVQLPEFPLLPSTKGFCLSLRNSLDILSKAVNDMSAEQK